MTDGTDGSRPRLVFDFALREGEAPTRLAFADPVAVYAAHRVSDVPDVLRAVEEATKKRGLWAAGFVAYEAASAFDPALVTHSPTPGLPLIWFGVFAEPSDVPTLTPCPSLASERGESEQEGVYGFASAFVPEQPLCRADAGQPPNSPLSLAREGQGVRVGDQKGKAAWHQSVTAIHEAIARGETYQVNLTRRLRALLPDTFDAFAFYGQLRAAQMGARYTAFLDTGRFRILSTSPELFFATEGRQITTRPMKGTAPRGRWNEEDDRLAAALAASEKNRAENVMIVDLLRNDVGRIAEIGSVQVPNLFTIERYPTILQMTSTVKATLHDNIGLPEIFGALFPCGSITGAPKVSTMRQIATLEKEPRGVYCGAIGIVRPGGDAVFNVGIRTVIHDNKTGIAEYGVGGGITWDSEAETEWAETLTKAAVLTKMSPQADFDLLETLRLENGAYFLRERHLARLAESAAYFQRTIDHSAISQMLDTFAAERPDGTWRVRLCVSLEGQPSLSSAAFSFGSEEPVPIQLAASPIDSRDVFLFHKTTRRAVYDGHRKALPNGIYDALLWNECGEVTESTIANLVAEIDGVRWTPPRSAGLLAGTFRAELLENGEIREQTLTIADVADASRLWLINSLRGWVPVRLVEK